MHKLILVSLFLPFLLFASTENEFLEDINNTYSKIIYKDLNILSINGFGKNNLQKEVKIDFEKILPSYLGNNSLFSTPALKEDRRKLKLKNFVYVSLLYIKYLESKGQSLKAQNLMRKVLIDLRSLMINSNDMFDYLVALAPYRKIYFNSELISNEMIPILKKHPIPNSSIFFEKLDFERLRIVQDINNMDVTKENYPVKERAKFMHEVREAGIEYTNIYFKKLELALKSNSKIEKDNFDTYMKHEESNMFGRWMKVKIIFHSLLLYIKYFLFDSYNYGFIADVTGNILALASVPTKIGNAYFKHIETIEIYNRLLKSNGE